MKVHTTESDLDKLASALDSSRKSSATVVVPRQALANIVCDAGEFFLFAQKQGKVENKGDA